MRLDGGFWGDAVSGVQPFRREDLVLGWDVGIERGFRVRGKGAGVCEMRGGAATDTGVLGAESALNEWLLPERGLKRKCCLIYLKVVIE
jgi:hypothetical protein